MVCERCIASVKEALADMPLTDIKVELGEVSFKAKTAVEESMIAYRLEPLGFELLPDNPGKLVKKIKALVDEVYSGDFEFPYHFRFFAFAAEQLKTNQETISEAFTAVENSTLERYIIDYRINKIKELLVYSDKTLADIAFVLGFSSLAHLSRQFKDNTGVSPSYFRQIKLSKNNLQTGTGS